MLKKFLENSKKYVVTNRRSKENNVLLSSFRKYVGKEASILDVGCGLGHNLNLLKSNGYLNITGTDISAEMRLAASRNGNEVLAPEELEKKEKFDAILFSHVLEHIGYENIQNFLEGYFSLLKNGGMVIICMPLIYDGFYHDVDHIKPYYAKGLVALFSNSSIPRQYSSNVRLKLIDINYIKEILLPYHLRCRHIRSLGNYVVLGILTFLCFALKFLSLGLVSKKVSYIAVLKLES